MFLTLGTPNTHTLTHLKHLPAYDQNIILQPVMLITLSDPTGYHLSSKTETVIFMHNNTHASYANQAVLLTFSKRYAINRQHDWLGFDDAPCC
jgi:hypothetical protein